jgi:hypothetical protein
MATQTYDFAHSDNVNIVTRVVLTDSVTPGFLNFSINIVRLDNGVVNFNTTTANDTVPTTQNITIFGQSIADTTYSYDWWRSSGQSVTTVNGSTTVNVTAKSLLRVGMTANFSQWTPPFSASISSISSSFNRVTISRAANGTRSGSVIFSRGLQPLSFPIVSGTLEVARGSTGTISGQNFARGSTDTGGIVGTATLSGSFTAALGAPTWQTTALPNATRNTSYTTSVLATFASSYDLQTAGTLPPGLSLSSSGLISGTPTTAGSFSFTVIATNTDGSSTRSFSILVNPSLPEYTDSSVASTAVLGTAYSDGVAAIEAASYSIFSGALPNGLSLNTSTGAITGTPTTSGTYTFIIRATNVTGSTNTGTLEITVTSGSRLWNGTTFVSGDTKAWNGTAFVSTTTKVWNGSAWINAK